MAKRKFPFEIGNYYHIYNRGTDKRQIFLDKGDLYYFFNTIQISNMVGKIESGDRNLGRKKIKEKIEKHYNPKPLVKIIAYAILPNHFHFVLREIEEGGISKFMKKLAGSYSLYFNKKYSRVGTLFQGRFKSSFLAYENSLDKTTSYVNLNYKHHNINHKKSLVKTSLFEYLGTEKGEKICSQKEVKNILDDFKNLDNYKKYLKNLSREFVDDHGHNPDLAIFSELED